MSSISDANIWKINKKITLHICVTSPPGIIVPTLQEVGAALVFVFWIGHPCVDNSGEVVVVLINITWFFSSEGEEGSEELNKS